MELLELNIEGKQSPPPTEGEARFQVALLAALVTTGASLFARFLLGAALFPERLADTLFLIMPITVVEIGTALLGSFAKHLAFIGCVVAYTAALTGAVAGLLRCVKLNRWLRAVWISLSLGALTLAASLLLPASSPLAVVPFSITLLAIHLILATALALLPSLFIENRAGGLQTAGLWLTRRRLMRWVGYSVVGVAVYDIGRSWFSTLWRGNAGRVSGGDNIFPNINGLAREVTPTEDFYQVSKNAFDPQVDLRRWKLEIAGLVDSPLSLTYEEIRNLPSVEEYATLECISNEVGGDLIGNALWRGVTLKDLLDKAGLRSEAVDIVLRATDGYSDSIPIERAVNPGTILAYEMNGAPLNAAHGFPLRLIVPGIFGMKNVKWITRIEAVDFDFKGYWQARGWDDRAEYKTMSRIDAPVDTVRGQATIAGIAFAGDRGISRVDVSDDGGKTWEPAEVKPPLSPYCWVLWHKEWRPGSPSRRRLVVRATDGRGVVQPSQKAPPIPDGASGYHQVLGVGEIDS